MAALTSVTKVSSRRQDGDRWIVTVKVPGVTNAADIWVAKEDLGLTDIDEVVGHGVLGDTPAYCSFVKNARGTGVAEGTNRGDLGVESSAAGGVTVEISVRGLG